jgi:hypothetical protein
MKFNMSVILCRMLFACLLLQTISFAEPIALKAQDTTCACQQVGELPSNFQICIGGSYYTVNLFGCISTPPPGQLLPAICPGSGQQNQYTTITKVCFKDSMPVPLDPQKVFEAILYLMNPCTNAGFFGANVPAEIGSLYCWTVMTPRCVFVDTVSKCISSCGTSCCRLARRFQRMADGKCEVSGTWSCPIMGTCESPCQRIEGCPQPNICP